MHIFSVLWQFCGKIQIFIMYVIHLLSVHSSVCFCDSFSHFDLFFCMFFQFFVCYWFLVAGVGAGQKVYGCALPPGYGSEGSQVFAVLVV